MAVQQLTCIICNNQFSFASRSGRKPNKCSQECKDEYYRRLARERRKRNPPSPVTKTMRSPCEGCGTLGLKTTKGLCKSCTAKSRKGLTLLRDRRRSGSSDTMPCLTTLVRRIPECECSVCGKAYRPKKGDRTTACSRACGHIWAGFKASAKRNGHRVFVVQRRARCKHCSSSFHQKGVETYCGDECRAAHLQGKMVEDYQPRTFSCAECAEHVETSYGDKRSVYCSDKCHKKAVRRVARKKERALLRQAKVEAVDPNKVFERDGWKCQQCRKKTPREKRGTYSANAPELDHIMPLSLGGEHSYRNTQCLCRACNSAKSNTPMGQLSLL